VKPEVSKTNRFLAQIVTDWYLTQADALKSPAGENRPPQPSST
jgi:hypothetical protein